jgi:hypothetical protein
VPTIEELRDESDRSIPTTAGECRVRDYYAEQLRHQRPDERVLKTEVYYATSNLRADMRTIDKNNVIREWEFKLYADYRALGQILQYVAIARHEDNFEKSIRGVIAAFEFSPELKRANEICNLNLELVVLPTWMKAAGGVIATGDNSPRISVIPPMET